MRAQGEKVSAKDLLSAVLVAAVMGRWCWADCGNAPQEKKEARTMPRTHLCKGCDVHWSPAMTINGACPACGSGCHGRTMERVSDEAYVYAELARIEREYREKLDKFDAYMMWRDKG